MIKKGAGRAKRRSKRRSRIDMTDGQWELIEAMVPPPKERGRPRQTNMRRVINGMFYIAKTGAQRRHLPRCYGPWQTCYRYWRALIDQGTWDKILKTLRTQVRRKAKRNDAPSAGIIDSQSVKGTAMPAVRGYDAAKKINGIKRHILVDTMGLLLAVLITTGCVQDRDGARQLLQTFQTACRGLLKIWVDSAYRGELIDWALSKFGIVIEPVLRPQGTTGFKLLPRRWVVERTFAWFDWNRRLSKHYEVLPECAAAFAKVAMIRVMLNRLA
jgi:putative transposase